MSNIPHTTESTETPKAAWPGWSFTILVLLLAFPSSGFIQKYAGLAGVAGYVAFVAITLFLIRKFGVRLAPLLRRHFGVLSVGAFAGLALCFAIVYPIENSRGLGKSSDRDDGLNLAVTRMAEGLSPYYQHDKFAGPLSVFPGGIALSSPFVALGNSAYQNFFWLAIFLYVVCWWFRDRALALVLLIVPLVLSPAAMYEYISGGDLLANGIYVAVFFLLALRMWSDQDASGWLRWLSCVLLGVGLASRPNFLLLMPLFGAVLWRTVGLRHAIAAAGLVVLAAAAITLPFYLYDPAGFTPFHAKQKLAVIDRALPWASNAIIAVTALGGIIGGCALMRHPMTNLDRSFFRWCALVTLCPMICAVALFSFVNGHVDFSFLHDRFGLMYVFFALLGWGWNMLDIAQTRGDSSGEGLV